MIELRGRGLLGESVFGRSYFQDHLPVRDFQIGKLREAGAADDA